MTGLLRLSVASSQKWRELELHWQIVLVLVWSTSECVSHFPVGRVHICMVAAPSDDEREAEQGEEKVWSLVQLIKESRKSPKALGGQVRYLYSYMACWQEQLKHLTWLPCPLLQAPINAVFDKAVFGHKVVMADILEADQSGNLPSSKPFTHKGGSAISNLIKQSKLVSPLSSLVYLPYSLTPHFVSLF